MHHIDIYLDNCQILTKNQNSLGIGHKKLGISVEKGRGRIKKGENMQKLKSQNVDRLTRRSMDQDRSTDLLGFWVLKSLMHFTFYIVLLCFFRVSLIWAFRD